MKPPIRRIHLLSILLLLVSCSRASTAAQDPTASPDPSAATQPPAASPTPTPVPSLLLITGEDAEQLQDALQDWSQELGWVLETRSSQNLEGWAEIPGLQAVVDVGSGLGAEELASVAQGVLVVAVDHPSAVPGEFLSTVGLYEARHHQAGFLAGALTGLASQSWVIAAISGGGDHDAVYLAAFDHGVKYACPRCWPVMMGAWEATADELLALRVDAVFVAPGAGQLSSSLSTAGIWVVYVEEAPQEVAADSIAGSVIFDPQVLVLAALEGLLDGEGGTAWPYAVDNGSMLLGPVNADAISPGRERILEDTFILLVSGELDVGVDPITGAESW